MEIVGDAMYGRGSTDDKVLYRYIIAAVSYFLQQGSTTGCIKKEIEIQECKNRHLASGIPFEGTTN